MEEDFLQKYRDAQKHYLETAKKELRNGDKCSHWIWFIFPQIEGLGRSEMNRKYSIKNIAEAKAYINDAELWKNYDECCQNLLEFHNENPKKSIAEIMSSIDALKLRSSLTLFKFATTDEDKQTLLNKMLEIFYGGQECGRTKSILGI
jgi:uncharacterized protein (DUF1810 family)